LVPAASAIRSASVRPKCFRNCFASIVELTIANRYPNFKLCDSCLLPLKKYRKFNVLTVSADTRRKRLNQAIDEYAHQVGHTKERGKVKRFCDEFDLNYRMVVLYRNGERNITDSAADELETSIKRPSGWLSKDSDEFLSKAAIKLARLFERLPDAGKAELSSYAEFIRARLEDDGDKRDSFTRLTASLKNQKP